jgi:D-alanine-D-alanine ligase-like ATP-grasp enzyme
MLNVSKSLSEIAVLRGGKKDFKNSLDEGVEVLQSLTKLGYHPLDVLIDAEGNWTSKGKPTDAHEIFTKAHTVVDTTRAKGETYQILAKKMQIPLLFSQANDVHLDREDMYRILRQQGVKVPDTFVVRASAPLKDGLFRELWTKYHTPLMVRPLKKTEGAPSRLIKLFTDLEKTLREYHAKGIDTHVLTYKKAPTLSVALLPKFRNQSLYTPIWVETFNVSNELPHKESVLRPHLQAPQVKKDQMQTLATKVYRALDLTGPATVDVISYNNNHIVVNVDTAPSLRKDGRFMQALETTGVDAGHYIHSRIQDDLSR